MMTNASLHTNMKNGDLTPAVGSLNILQAFQEYFVSEAYYQNNSFFGKGDKKTLQRYAWLYNKTAPKETIPPDDLSMAWDEIFKSEW